VVPLVNPVSKEVNAPVPDPSLVFVVRVTVGFCVVLHTIPRAVTEALPCNVTLPPLVAVVPVIDVIDVVVIKGRFCPIRENQ
jgi:hypothetical protein